MNPTEDKILQALKAQLDAQAEGLDAATLSLLHQARTRAVERANKKSLWQSLLSFSLSGANPWWRSASYAALALFSVGIALHQFEDLDTVGTAVAVIDSNIHSGGENSLSELEIAAIGEDIDLIDELEFYDWLNQLEEPNEQTSADRQSSNSKA